MIPTVTRLGWPVLSFGNTSMSPLCLAERQEPYLGAS